MYTPPPQRDRISAFFSAACQLTPTVHKGRAAACSPRYIFLSMLSPVVWLFVWSQGGGGSWMANRTGEGMHVTWSCCLLILRCFSSFVLPASYSLPKHCLKEYYCKEILVRILVSKKVPLMFTSDKRRRLAAISDKISSKMVICTSNQTDFDAKPLSSASYFFILMGPCLP